MPDPFLTRAYELARPEHPHPNPRVGAVVVAADGRVIGEGAHRGPGRPHAEVVALDASGGAAGATVYVSLEPCAHHGRTPPCVDRLISEKVARVVVGAADPDPQVSGLGIQRLKEAGIEVEVIDDPEAHDVDPAYFHHRRTGRPLVTVKYAMTLDGSSAAIDLSSQWITGETAREDAHGLRAVADAVVIGAGTLIEDDPRLDVRIPGHAGPQPRPVVIAGDRSLPDTARIWERDPIVIATRDIGLPSGELVVVAGDGRPDPGAACSALAERGMLDVLVEGGAGLTAAWWRAGMVDRGVVYVGGKIGGGSGVQPMGRDEVFSNIGDARSVSIIAVRQVGADIRIDFNVGS